MCPSGRGEVRNRDPCSLTAQNYMRLRPHGHLQYAVGGSNWGKLAFDTENKFIRTSVQKRVGLGKQNGKHCARWKLPRRSKDLRQGTSINKCRTRGLRTPAISQQGFLCDSATLWAAPK